MTKEDEKLLFKDICARLPYGVMAEITSDGGLVEASYNMRLDAGLLADLLNSEDDFKPYLRPMSSMTMGEQREYISVGRRMSPDNPSILADWLNANHFNYRLPHHLFIEAPEDMYKTE